MSHCCCFSLCQGLTRVSKGTLSHSAACTSETDLWCRGWNYCVLKHNLYSLWVSASSYSSSSNFMRSAGFSDRNFVGSWREKIKWGYYLSKLPGVQPCGPGAGLGIGLQFAATQLRPLEGCAWGCISNLPQLLFLCKGGSGAVTDILPDSTQ